MRLILFIILTIIKVNGQKETSIDPELTMAQPKPDDGGGSMNYMTSGMPNIWCCPVKTITGSSDPLFDGVYNFYDVAGYGMVLPPSCSTPCIYVKEGGSYDQKFCMAPSMTSTSTCGMAGNHESSNNISSLLPALDNSNYTDKGEVFMLEDDLPVYVVGDNATGKAIIWNYDIFGFDSGRTRQFADMFSENGFLVIIPDYFRGTWLNPANPGSVNMMEFMMTQTNWEGKLKGEWENIILPYVKNMNIDKIGVMGTCWGSYLTIRLSQYNEVNAGVSMHPSHSPIMAMFNESEADILTQLALSNTPQLILTSMTDSENVKPGGLTQQVLGDDLVTIVDFPEMNHGWTIRGDIEDPKVARDVNKAVKLALDFFINKN